MAKILFTAIVADMRNKLNGSVFSKNRYGAYVRTKVTPVNPQSPAQQLVRNRLSTNSQAWRNLTEAERQSWINAAADFPQTDIFGNTKTLSGNALYVRLNNNLATLAELPLASAPAPVAIPTLILVSAVTSAGAGLVELTTGPGNVPALFSIVVEATPMISPGVSFVKNRYRQTLVKPPLDNALSSFGLAYIDKFGPLVEGQKLFFRAFMVSNVTGQAGIPVSLMTLVDA